jgi:predicted Zn-dependent protease
MAAKGGQVIPKELTEEEKEEAEANAKTKGKAPPKGKGKEEEISPEEQERLDQEKAEKEEKERRLQEEWDALDEATKFYRTNEDPFKEPSIKFQIEVQDKPQTPSPNEADEENKEEAEPQNEGEEQAPKTHMEDMTISEVKKSDSLIELEETIKTEQGCWIYFSKLLPKEEEEAPDPKKKGKGGKGAPTEDEKPVYGRAWLDLSTLKEPGETKVEAKITLETAEAPKAKPKEDEENKEPAAEPEGEGEAQIEQVFEEPKTYIILEFELNEPIVPTAEDFVMQALPHDLIIPKAIAQAKVKPMKDPEGDFRKMLKLTIESINKEYLGMFEEDLRREGIGGCTDETFEARKEQFLYEFNSDGKYHLMKEKLKKTVVKIVRDTFKKKSSFKGLHMNEKDHFYSTMYAHLVNQIHICLSDMVGQRKDILHENVVIKDNLEAEKETERLIDSKTNETEDERLERLAQEYEEVGNLDKANNYYFTRTNINPDNMELWRNYAMFMLRNYGMFDRAEEYLKEAISLCEENDDSLFLTYGALLVQMQEKKKALIFLTKVGQEEEDQDNYIRAHLLLSILYKSLEETELSEKHFAYASRMFLRREGVIPAKGQSKETPPAPETSDNPRELPQLNDEQKDALYFDLIENLLLPEQITQLANTVTEYIQDDENPKLAKIKAKILLGERNYSECVEALEDYLDDHKFDVEALKIFADAHYFQEKYEESEKLYLRAVRRGCDDTLVKKRLGLIYIRTKKWREAHTVFQEYCNEIDSRCAYAWRYLGMAGWKLRAIDGADKAFIISNMLDNSNAETWGLLTITCLIIGVAQNRAFQSYQKAIRLGLANYEIFAELAFLLTKTKKTHRDAEF